VSCREEAVVEDDTDESGVTDGAATTVAGSDEPSTEVPPGGADPLPEGSKENEGIAVRGGIGSITLSVRSSAPFLGRRGVTADRKEAGLLVSCSRNLAGEQGSEGFITDEEKAGKRGGR
jgi:hypothetical protein